jgi:hypothetical protein
MRLSLAAVTRGKPPRVLGADESGHRVRGFTHLSLGLGAAMLDGLRYAMTKMILKQAERDGLKGTRNRGHLGEHVDAVSIVGHHALQPAHLALDAPQPSEVGVLFLRIPSHGTDSTPWGYVGRGR